MKKGKDQKATKGLVCSTNFTYQYHRKCIEDSVEEVHFDVRVYLVRTFATYSPGWVKVSDFTNNRAHSLQVGFH